MRNNTAQTPNQTLMQHLGKLRVAAINLHLAYKTMSPEALKEVAHALEVASGLAIDAAYALEALQPTTADGVRVAPGDTVFVIGSVDVHEARVRPLDALTDYYLFGLLPVSGAYSTEKAALQARQIGHLAGKAGS